LGGPDAGQGLGAASYCNSSGPGGPAYGPDSQPGLLRRHPVWARMAVAWFDVL